MLLMKLLARLFRRKEHNPSCCDEKPQVPYRVCKSTSSANTSASSTSSSSSTTDVDCPILPIPCLTGNIPHPNLRATYNGGYADACKRGVCLRIANGGAGQTGLIQAWADAFIQHRVACGDEPFEIAWYLGDTTDSLAMLASGMVDFAITYNAAAEKQCMDAGAAKERVYAFRDHFILAGPRSNPANLKEKDDILTMFNHIVTSGNRDTAHPPDPEIRPPTRFLSRFDKSATNIKESFLFATIGQVPWAFDCCKWYHQYPRFPREALETASLLSEYTLTDFGTWISAPTSVTSRLSIFKMGSDAPDDLLLNPAHLLYGSRASVVHVDLCRAFVDWVKAPSGGQRVIEGFSKSGHVLYSKAPVAGVAGWT